MDLQQRLKTAVSRSEPLRTAAATRLDSIDQFRGFATLAMVLGNYIVGIAYLPTWLKHSPDIGLTIIDLGAPWFIFAISLTAGLSARRRIKAAGAACSGMVSPAQWRW
jgi:predicted acyltransferase